MKFVAAKIHPDYKSNQPGAALGGRALAALPYDGRLLGLDFDRVRPPRPEFMILGGMMVAKADIPHLLKPFSSASALANVLRLVVRYGFDRLRYRRGTRLVMGNALVARLFKSSTGQERSDHLPDKAAGSHFREWQGDRRCTRGCQPTKDGTNAIGGCSCDRRHRVAHLSSCPFVSGGRSGLFAVTPQQFGRWHRGWSQSWRGHRAGARERGSVDAVLDPEKTGRQ